jgi:3-deoxy-D-manno-octulosonate 8-phosphate phosphatase (KDO 8-P phosphatase)
VHEVLLGRIDKAAAFAEVIERRNLQRDQVAYVGDDLLDLPVMQQVAFAATVPEGRPEVRAAAHYTARTPAGFGAVREIIEVLLRAKGLWDDVVARGGLP